MENAQMRLYEFIGINYQLNKIFHKSVLIWNYLNNKKYVIFWGFLLNAVLPIKNNKINKGSKRQENVTM